MLSEIFLLVIVYGSTQSAKVIEAEDQKGIYVTDYCPKMKYCPEGAHVMCMYYNPKSVMGPHCRNFQNISINTEMANKFLDVINAVRSKIARGMEKGKDGVHLPRGYGIFRLRWDSELATFAQVLANQCVMRHDLCRASKKFPDPGQTAGLVRFSVPDWIPVSKMGKSKPKDIGLDDKKLLYATTQSLKSWYQQKSGVTSQMVTSYPDWTKNPNDLMGRLYLEIIYGPATHMGCGLAAYTEYAYYESTTLPLNYNSILVVCNFSARPRTGTAVVNTVPPSDTESPFNPCGCPAGSIEDDDCLCLEVTQPDPLPVVRQKAPCPPGINCDPTVVLLPIFTVEDAPPNKLVSSGNMSIGRTHLETNVADSFEELFDKGSTGNKGILHQSRKTYELSPHGSNGQKQRPTLNGVTVRNRHFDVPRDTINQNRISQFNFPNDAKNLFYHNESKDHVVGHIDSTNGVKQQVIIRSRYFDHPNEVKDHRELEQHDKTQTHKQIQKSSVFSKTPIFELPGSHYFLTTRKRDVVPRKDFSTGKQLVSKYLYNKNSIPITTPRETPKYSHSHEKVVIEVKSVETVGLNNDLNHPHTQPKEHKNNIEHHEEVQFHDILTTETNLNTAEQSIMNHNKDIIVLNLSQDYDKFDEKRHTPNSSDDSDNKLMALLDTLEQEVKHIELHDKEKQIFDAKIKKIYGKVVGKPGSTALTVTEKLHIEHTTEADNDVHNLPPSFDTPDDESNFIDDPSYRKHDTDQDIDEMSKRDILEMDTDDLERPMITKSKSRIPYDVRAKYSQRGKNNMRNRNRIDSFEFTKHRYETNYKGRKSYKGIFRNDLGKLKHRTNNLDYKRKGYYGDAYEDPLSVERRKYYQDKLDSMERKLQDVRRYNNRRKEAGRSPHMRAMKQNFRSDNQMNPLYAGRARILHGY